MDTRVSTAQIEKIVGGLAQTEKMPGASYSLPAQACKTGSKLRKDPKSPCSKCYAMKGRYTFPVVREALKRRLEATKRKDWTDHMVNLIQIKTTPEVPYFRWFDSGDVQNKTHFRKILKVANALPDIKFWMPTQEYKVVQNETIPNNLVVRVSEPHFGFKRTREASHTSSVAPKLFKKEWSELVALNTEKRWHCPASLQDNKCNSCRACWKKNIRHVIYPQH